MNKYAYATVASKDIYVPFIIREKQRMDYLKCQYPFIVLCTDTMPEISIQELINYNIQIKKVPNICFTLGGRYADTLNKFQCFNLEEFDKILFFDADIIIKDNCDVLLEKIELYDNDAICIPAPHDNDFHKLINIHKVDYIAWTMLIKPSTYTYNQIIKILTNEKYEADEEFINYSLVSKLKIDLNNFYTNFINTHPLFHPDGVYKINNLKNNNFIQTLFNYKVYNEIIFNNMFDNNYQKLIDFARDKLHFEDYCFYLNSKCTHEILNQGQSYCYFTSLQQENQLPLIMRMKSRLSYLKSKFPFAVILSQQLKNNNELINQLIKNNILVIINNTLYPDNLFCTTLIQYNKIIYLQPGIILKENIDNFYYNNIQNKSFIIVGNDDINNNFIQIIYTHKSNILIEALNNNQYIYTIVPALNDYQKSKILNFIYKNKNINDYIEEPFIQQLFYTISEIEFNYCIDKYYNEIYTMINEFQTFQDSLEDLNKESIYKYLN